MLKKKLKKKSHHLLNTFNVRGARISFNPQEKPTRWDHSPSPLCRGEKRGSEQL